MIVDLARGLGCWLGIMGFLFGQQEPPAMEASAAGAAVDAVWTAPRVTQIFAAGEAKVSADSAVVSLAVRVENSALATAVNRSTIKKSALSKKFRSAGIPEEDVVFENFSSDTQTGFLSNKVKRYTVTNPIRVKIRKESQFATLALLVDADGEVFYTGRHAEVSDPTESQMKAAEDAIKNLKRKVALYESEFDVELTLISFEELLPGQTQGTLNASNWTFQPPNSGKISHRSNPLTSGLRSGRNAISENAIDGLIASQGSFGELTSSVRIQGVYLITSPSKQSTTR